MDRQRSTSTHRGAVRLKPISLLRHGRAVQARRKGVDALSEGAHVQKEKRAVHRFDCE
jgi:hypothetical protein